jgi:hypothetical protein
VQCKPDASSSTGIVALRDDIFLAQIGHAVV